MCAMAERAPVINKAVMKPQSGNHESFLDRSVITKALYKESGIEVLARLLKNVPLTKEFPLGTPMEIKGKREEKTALHELFHAQSIIELGGIVVSISVEPDATSWGRTVFAGLTPEESQVAAMASVARGADGTVGDRWHTKVIEAHGGLTERDAENIARSTTNVWGEEIEQKAAFMLAFMGTVSGTKLSEIIQRATLEVYIDKILNKEIRREDLPNLPHLLAMLEKSQEHLLKVEPFDHMLSPDRTEIIDNKNQTTDIVVYVHGVKNETLSKNICSRCGKENGHYVYCPVIKETNKQEEKNLTQWVRRDIRKKFLNEDQIAA